MTAQRRTQRVKAMLAIFALLATLMIWGPVPEADAGTSSLNIVALGDSYTSGTGGTNYYGPSGCYRSYNVYAEVFANRLRQDGIDVKLTNLACHGALSRDLPNQIAQISTLEKPQVDLVLLTIGGNDGNFAEIVKQCFIPLTKNGADCQRAVMRAFNDMGTITANVKNRLEEIAVLLPKARIVMLGYPYPLADVGYTTGDLGGVTFPSGSQVRALVNLFDAANQVSINSLNGRYANRFRYISTKERFAGHENFGTKALWLRGTLDTPIVWEWWHPNAEGYRSEGLYLYELQIHSGLSRSYRYLNLPLGCGVKVNYATTYDYTVIGGVRYYHGQAIDLPAAQGTPIVAPASGVLTAKYDRNGYGYYADVKEPNGLVHRMAHMKSPSIVASGSSVSQGQLIGYVGSSGLATGSHLHYEQLRGSSQVPIVLQGGVLSWTAKLSSTGYRKTTHSLLSGNCSVGSQPAAPPVTPPPLPSAGGVDELLFYSASNGLLIYNDVGPSGVNIQLNNLNLSVGWDIVVPIEIDGDNDSELLLYDREGNGSKGKAQIFNINVGGNLTLLQTLDWLNCWTHILAVEMDGDGRDELLIYSADTGYYYFHDVAGNGDQRVIKEGSWSTGWKIIQALEFDGTSGDELLFYRAYSNPGLGLAYDLDRNGLIYEKQVFSNWLNIWTHILPIDLDGDNRDELLIYSASTGYYYLHDVYGNGAQAVITEGTWSTGWDLIVALNADGMGSEELLFYDNHRADGGLGLIYRTSASGAITELAVLSWSNFWSVIAPVEMD